MIQNSIHSKLAINIIQVSIFFLASCSVKNTDRSDLILRDSINLTEIEYTLKTYYGSPSERAQFLYFNGDFYAIIKDVGVLIKLNKDSSIDWSTKIIKKSVDTDVYDQYDGLVNSIYTSDDGFFIYINKTGISQIQHVNPQGVIKNIIPLYFENSFVGSEMQVISSNQLLHSWIGLDGSSIYTVIYIYNIIEKSNFKITEYTRDINRRSFIKFGYNNGVVSILNWEERVIETFILNKDSIKFNNVKKLDFRNIKNLDFKNKDELQIGGLLDFSVFQYGYYVAAKLLDGGHLFDSDIIMAFDLNGELISSNLVKGFKGLNKNDSYFKIELRSNEKYLYIIPLSDIHTKF